MESIGYYISVDDGVIDVWHSIGLSEDLATDGDIAQFLVALYSSLNQKERKQSGARCVHCHTPLTLYCTTCQLPSHQALSSPQTLSSPQAKPTQQVQPLNAGQCQNPSTTVTFQCCDDTLDPRRSDDSTKLSWVELEAQCGVVYALSGQHAQVESFDPHKNSPTFGEAGDAFDSGDDVDDDAGFFDLSVENVESRFSACELEPSSIKSGSTIKNSEIQTRSKLRSAAKDSQIPVEYTYVGRRRMQESLVQENTTTAPMEIEEKRGNRHLKVGRRELVNEELTTERNSSAGTASHAQSLKSLKVVLTRCDTGIKKSERMCETKLKELKQECDISPNESEGSCDASSEEKSQQMSWSQKQQLPLESGVIPEEERRFARIHVYDEGYLQRRAAEDSAPRKLKKKKQKQTHIDEMNAAGCSLDKEMEDFLESMEQNKCDLVEKFTPTGTAGEEPASSHGESERLAFDSLQSHESETNNSMAKTLHVSTETVSHCNSQLDLEQLTPLIEAESKDLDGLQRRPKKILISARRVRSLKRPNGKTTYYSYFECAHCRKAFRSKRAFNHHIKEHLVPKLYDCSICGKLFASLYRRSSHQSRHYDVKKKKNFKCDACSKVYTRERNLTEHRQLHLQNNGVFKCRDCDFETTDFFAFQKHRKNHWYFTRSVQCEFCGLYLKRPDNLRKHITGIHKGERPFQCTQCEKTFVTQHHLKTHIQASHDENGKRFRCDVCGKRFFRRADIPLHMTVHTGEKPFKCTFCPSAFARKYYLTVHLRLHTGERPHKCSDCPAAFAGNTSLTQHRKTHHGIQPASHKKKRE